MRQVAKLEGAALDAAVAKCEGVSRFYTGDCFVCSPSVDWECGGPIIERERMRIGPSDEHGWWAATVYHQGVGQTALIAAMRAYVASTYGEWIELPE